MPEPPPSPFPPHPRHPVPYTTPRLAYRLASLPALHINITAIPVVLGQEDRCFIRGDTLELRELQGSLLGIPSTPSWAPGVPSPGSRQPASWDFPSSVRNWLPSSTQSLCLRGGFARYILFILALLPLLHSPFLVLPEHFFHLNWYSTLLFISLHRADHLECVIRSALPKCQPYILSKSLGFRKPLPPCDELRHSSADDMSGSGLTFTKPAQQEPGTRDFSRFSMVGM